MIDQQENTINTTKTRYDRQSYLSQEIMQEMIKKILCGKKMSKEELATNLGVQADDIDRLQYRSAYNQLAPQINLRLINVYCHINWECD